MRASILNTDQADLFHEEFAHSIIAQNGDYILTVICLLSVVHEIIQLHGTASPLKTNTYVEIFAEWGYIRVPNPCVKLIMGLVPSIVREHFLETQMST
jgi:hypothetical protein